MNEQGKWAGYRTENVDFSATRTKSHIEHSILDEYAPCDDCEHWRRCKEEQLACDRYAGYEQGISYYGPWKLLPRDPCAEIFHILFHPTNESVPDWWTVGRPFGWPKKKTPEQKAAYLREWRELNSEKNKKARPFP